ncbi:hypothetical protein L208DRAFT_1297564, partial [Tricholoma matsutake]
VPDRYHESILYLGPEETRGIRHCILEISDMLCFRRRVYSIFVISFEGPEETRGLSVCILEIFHIFCLGRQMRGAHVHVLEIFHILWFWGGLSCILVSSPLFFIIEGLFTMYSSLI